MQYLKRYYFLQRYRKKKTLSGLEGISADSSSISDIAFLLLIFFVVSSSFFVPQGILYQLPSSDGVAQKIPESKVVEVFIQNEGYLLQNRNYTDVELEEFLAQELKESPEKLLVVYMSKKVQYGRLVETFSLARRSGVKKISLEEKEKNAL